MLFRSEVMQALKEAQCEDIIAKLPDGIDTVIGSSGTYVSGGEAQRLSIARAMLKNAPILILDEATAFADPDNEAKVQEDIHAKLTVTERTGMASYEYPADQQYGTVIIGGGISATPIEQAAIVITAPNKCEGYAEGGNFCGLRTPYKVYFVAEFDTDALESGTWKRDELKPNTTFAEGEYSGVYFTFDVNKKKNIQYKIGVSYVSVENARENLKAENTGWDFLQIQNQAESKWNHYLGKIEVEGTNPDRTTQFYTHLYRSFIHPNVCSDVNGEYMGVRTRNLPLVN